MAGVIPVYRGYTHAAISLLRSSPVAWTIDRYLKDHLLEKEYVPESNRYINGRWRKVWAHWEPKYKYYRYDTKSQKLYVPIAFCDDIVALLRREGLNVDIRKENDYPLRKIDVAMKPGWTDKDHQIELIKACSNPEPGMRGLSMQTGKGKTYSAIKSWVNLGYVGIVIVGGLVDQWIDSIRECTNIDKDYIYKLQEFDSLNLLAHNPQYKPLIFVASLKTMQLFCDGSENYGMLPWDFAGFFREYGIGVKIVDECHRCFHATVLMDLATNVPYPMYASATFTQSSRQAREIFNRVFPTSIQYGLQAYDKYVECYFHTFLGEVQEKKVMKKRGYNHVKYEKELMICERKLNTHVNEVLQPLIDMYYINRKTDPKQRLLIFCSSIEFIEALVCKLKRLYPDHIVKSYIGGNALHDIDDAQIIVSTPGKASTGLDLKRLIAVLNTVSISAESTILQLFGRLRKIEGMRLAYVDVSDSNIAAVRRHAEERMNLLRKVCTRFYYYEGLHDLSVQSGTPYQGL